MGRILSIWLPQLPLDRLMRAGDPRLAAPFAITVDRNNATRLAHINVDARKAGLAPGLSVPDARAICPELLTEPSDPLREGDLLRALWRWADQFSPRIALDAPNGLLLDITGCAHLFGDEAEMAQYVTARLADIHITSQIGIADTKRAARALARFGAPPITIAEPGKTSAALALLPIDALDLEKTIVHDLAQAGLKTIGQLYEVKSSELARRFGLGLIKAIGSATGVMPDPITPMAADSVYAARMSLPDPIGYRDDLENVLTRLSKSVCDRLAADQKGARRFNMTVRCVDTGDHVLSVGFARPCFEPGPLLQQFAKPLDDLKIEFGADWFRLHADHIESVRFKQTKFGTDERAKESFDRLVTTLGNRLGFDHVRRFTAHDSHLPEREFMQTEAVSRAQAERWEHRPRKRPIRLFPEPEYLRPLAPGRPPGRFEWRRKTYETAKASGPERLTPEWWREEKGRLRDYWRVETQEGPRLWLVTYPGAAASEWFIAGKFS